MKFVLIVMFNLIGVLDNSATNAPVLGFTEFDDKPACEAAADMVAKMSKGMAINKPNVYAVCVPKGTIPPPAK